MRELSKMGLFRHRQNTSWPRWGRIRRPRLLYFAKIDLSQRQVGGGFGLPARLQYESSDNPEFTEWDEAYQITNRHVAVLFVDFDQSVGSA
jgi:hypothetical protein